MSHYPSESWVHFRIGDYLYLKIFKRKNPFTVNSLKVFLNTAHFFAKVYDNKSTLKFAIYRIMVEIVCTSQEFAKTLKDSVQWQLLIRYLERQGVSASIWVEGEDHPAFAQIPDFTPGKSSKAAQAKPQKACTIA